MSDQSAQLQALEQALQDKGITYGINKAIPQKAYQHSGDTNVISTTIEVEIYDTGE